MTEGRVFVLGMDGLDPEIVKETRISEVLESKGLDQDYLESVVPPITVPAWACSFTGLEPDEVECFDFQELDTEKKEFVPVNRRIFNSRGYWNYSQSSSVLFDVPGVDKPEMDGVFVGGIFDFGEVRARPERLADQLEEELGSPDIERMEELGSESERLEEARRIFSFRGKVLDWLVKNTEEDIYFNVFRLPDTTMHHTSSMEEMKESYEAVAEYLENFLEDKVAEEDEVLVVSDHGAAKYEKEFHINSWLENEGFLRRKEQASLLETLVYRVADMGRRLGLRDLLIRLNDTSKEKAGLDLAPDKSEVMDKVDFESSKAFGFVTGVCAFGGVWINDDRVGGVVGDVESVKSELISALGEVEEIVEAHDAERFYGNRPESFPDIVVELTEDTKFTSSFHPDPISNVSGFMHRKNGFLGSSKEIRSEPRLVDVAPAILQLRGETIPNHMSGSSFVEGSESRESRETAGLDF